MNAHQLIGDADFVGDLAAAKITPINILKGKNLDAGRMETRHQVGVELAARVRRFYAAKLAKDLKAA